MIEDYLSGSIRQSIERIRQLRGIALQRSLREYDGLKQICVNHLDRALNELTALLKERVVDVAIQTPRRVRTFKRVVDHLNAIEGIGIFALSRKSPDDDFLNKLITQLCNEINYPLIPPVVSQMSQDYFHIYPDFNLLCLPVVESRFLLHLPDIYHELCHPLHLRPNFETPALEPYAKRFKEAVAEMHAEFQRDIDAADRLNKHAHIFEIQIWRTCWTKYWMEELFCDLFGVLTAGPAFAWSHYHLCVKRGNDPFETPTMFETSHPADDARMRALLQMLRSNPAFHADASAIEMAWQDFLQVMGMKAPPEYRQCFSDKLITNAVELCAAGVSGIGIQVAGSAVDTPVRKLLNEAWRAFWRDTSTYAIWEAQNVEALRNTVVA